jgi:hypothetical protein
MEFATDNLLARILLTLAVVGFAFAPAKADFNATHATNPLWTPHARFHVVWQVTANLIIGLIALGLIWIGGPLATGRLYLAAALGAAVLGGFFITALARPVFGGTFHDENGYRPFRPPFGPAHWRFDVNVTVFTIVSAILVLGVLAI